MMMAWWVFFLLNYVWCSKETMWQNYGIPSKNYGDNLQSMEKASLTFPQEWFSIRSALHILSYMAMLWFHSLLYLCVCWKLKPCFQLCIFCIELISETSMLMLVLHFFCIWRTTWTLYYISWYSTYCFFYFVVLSCIFDSYMEYHLGRERKEMSVLDYLLDLVTCNSLYSQSLYGWEYFRGEEWNMLSYYHSK